MAQDINEADQGTNVAANVAVGEKVPTKIDLTQASTAIDFPTRGISSVGGTVVLVDMECSDDDVTEVPIPAGGWFPIINVTAVRGTDAGTDATSVTVWPW